MNQYVCYAILDLHVLAGRCPIAMTRRLLAAGITLLQVRAKAYCQRQVAQLLHQLHPLTQAAQVPLLINDDVCLALALGLEGVHVGVHDCAPSFVRRCLPQAIIGYSPEVPTDPECWEADYLGIGPFSHTTTKSDAGQAIGAAGIAQYTHIRPVVAVGGVTANNVAQAFAAGAKGVAICQALLDSQHPGHMIQTIKKAQLHG